MRMLVIAGWLRRIFDKDVVSDNVEERILSFPFSLMLKDCILIKKTNLSEIRCSLFVIN